MRGFYGIGGVPNGLEYFGRPERSHKEANMRVEKLIPSFIRKEPEPEIFEIPQTAMLPHKIAEPTIAKLPPPVFNDHEQRVAAEAAMQVAAFQRERRELNEKLEAHANDAKKIGFLELENNQLRTEIQTLQSDLNDLRRYLSLQKQVYDRFNIKAPEKKKRVPRAKKTQSAPEVKADGDQ
jgi:hypothetical protein